MIAINTNIKYSSKVYGMYYTSILITLFLISLLFGLLFHSFINTLLILLFIIGIPWSIYQTLKIDSKSFVITENSITKNTGILLKRSNTVTFDKIQNIECITGMLLEVFGLSHFYIWTASPSQITFNKGTSQHIPDIILVLDSSDANWLKDYILSKRTQPSSPISATQSVPPLQATPTPQIS